MNNARLDAVTRMLNAFPPTSDNFDLLLDTYAQQLEGLSTEAVELAVRRYLSGDVPEQSRKYAPTVPEFIQEARRCQEVIGIQSRPKLPKPVYRSSGMAPFEIKMAKARAEHAHLPILFEDIGYDQWRKLCAERQIPTGAVWVACLGTVYGPATTSSIDAEAA